MPSQTNTPPASRPILSVGDRARRPDTYLVWGRAPHRKRPSRRHPTLAEATREAERIATLYPGEQFDVYRLTHCARKASKP